MNFAIILIGFTSIILQFVLIRELQITFLGNELSLGVILTLWLFGSSMGSFSVDFVLKKLKNYKKALSFLLLFLCLWCIAGLFLSRLLKVYLGINLYEIPSLFQIFIITSITIIPLSFSLGSSFIIASAIIEAPIKVYTLEAWGAFCAGLISLILPFYFNSTQIISYLVGFVLFSVFFLLRKERDKILRWITLLVLLLYSLLVTNPLSSKFQNITNGLRFKPQKLIVSVDSIYGNIAITKSQNVYSLYENGKLYFTSEDTESLEEFADMVLLPHPNPKKILLVGSGASGLIAQILKFPIEKIDYVELDHKLIYTSLRYMPDAKNYGLYDPRVNIFNKDARLFVKSSKSKYDLIIMNLGDPLSLQLNRFYTTEFFKTIRNILSEGGLFCFSISSKEDILRGEILKYNTSIYKSAKNSFGEVEIVPGERLIMICSQHSIPNLLKPEILEQRFIENKINNQFFWQYHIKAKLLRKEYVAKSLNAGLKNISENQDYKPSGFFYALCAWGKSSWLKFAKIMQWLQNLNLAYLLTLVFILHLIWKKNVVKIAVFTTGFLSIALEVIIAFLFQINFGFLYYQLGAIIGCFMFGAALGSMAFHIKKNKTQAEKTLLYPEAAICILLLSCPLILKDSSLAYLFMSGAIGALTGYEFGIFCKIYPVSTVYSLDLAGACFGSLLVSLAFVPTLGIYKTSLLLGLTKFIGLLFLRKQAR